MVSPFKQKGFTLIEVIVTLVLVAIVGAMVASYMGTTTRQTGKTLTWLNDEFELSHVMERIVADYREELYNGSLNLPAFVAARNSEGKVNILYGTSIDEVQVAATDFTADTPGDPSTDYTESGVDSTIQKITLRKGDQTLITILTE